MSAQEGDSRQHRIGLVACCSQKLDCAAPARDLYTSALFRKSRVWVERNCDEWAILSALHGLVMPTEVISPYEETLNKMPMPKVRSWAREVRRQLESAWPATDVTFIVLAGAKYRLALEGLDYQDPLEGLAIGKRLSWLNAQLGLS